MRRRLNKEAFTLVEIIVGITVLTIVLVSIAILTLTSIRANQANIHRLTAYYLAQESLEGFRNMRDSNWKQNYVWNGGADFWGADFNGDGYYVIDREIDTRFIPGAEVGKARSAAPWELNSFGEDVDAARVAGQLVDRPYVRYVEVRYESEESFIEGLDDSKQDLMGVTVHVEWIDHARPQSLMVSTELSDWQQNPI